MRVERFANSVPGFLSAFEFQPHQPAQPLDELALQADLADGPGWLWLHLNLTDRRCTRWLSQKFGHPDELIAEFSAASRRHYLRQQDNCWIGQLPAYRRNDAGEPEQGASLSVLIGGRTIITGRTAPLHAPEELRAELARGALLSQPFDILSHLLSTFVTTAETFHGELLEELERIEDRVLDERPGRERQRLMLMRRKSATTHRHIRSLRRALGQASRHRSAPPSPLEALTNQLTNIDTDFDNLEQRARFFHDEIDAKLAAETNRQLYLLSIVTAAFLPPSLVAGLFGMNVQGIPFAQSAHGFWWALAAGLASAIIVGCFISLANRRR